MLCRFRPRCLAQWKGIVSMGLRSVIHASGHPPAGRRGMHGIFVNYVGQERPYFFSCPGPPYIHGDLSLPPPLSYGEVMHHSNGLLLLENGGLFVCNPATRRWTELPRRPAGGRGAKYLMFDPAESLHYQVIFFPGVPSRAGNKARAKVLGSCSL
ncbi:hypothetical protein ACQ4PT_020686 [Festuca glaucescens]